MTLPEWIPLVITAVLGSAGIASLATQLMELTRPRRLTKRLQAACDLLQKLPPEVPRRPLETALERDVQHLAAMTLVRTSKSFEHAMRALYGLALFAAAVVVAIMSLVSSAPGATAVDHVLSQVVPPVILLVGLSLCIILWMLAGALLAIRKRRAEYRGEAVEG
jgi:hypothetical protein